jgi:hypothetical protein
MGTGMKTTVEISAAILKDARALARREGVTVRLLVEEGLRTVLAARHSRARFRLKDASFNGRGLQDGVDEGRWDQIRDAIYASPARD